MFRIFAAALAFLGALTLASAHEIKLGDLTITDLWTRATPPGAPTAGGYMTIANAGSEEERLIAVSSPLADHGELHSMQMKDGMMIMRPVAGGIIIPAGGKVSLDPDGLHIMFVGPKEPLKEGGKFPVTLTFAKAGKIDTFMHILAIGATGPASMPAMKM